MNDKRMTCDDVLLDELLCADDGSDEFRSAAEHVETCPACREKLSQLAADEAEWSSVRQSLSPGAAESEILDECRRRVWYRCDGRQPAAQWAESVARQMLDSPSHPEMMGQLGRYQVERLLGAGGMGVVFKAFDGELHRPVAIKVLAPYLSGSGAARKRFAREARAAAAVVHEHVVAIHNVETDGQLPYLVMQYVAGESLQRRLDRDGPLDVGETLRIAYQTAAGLAAAHAQGLVHRDVKPSNILLEQGVSRALLTDFGLARAGDDASLTRSGYLPGTPHYMSPEQARGDSVDARSDLFSLGTVIYTMCTGHPPFRAETGYGVLRRITDTEPRPMRESNSDVPEWLDGLVAKLLSKRPEDRFGSAEQAALVLEQCLAHVQQPSSAALPAVLEAAPKFGRRFDWRVAGSLFAFVAVVLLGLILPKLWPDPSANLPAPSPERQASTSGDAPNDDVSHEWNAAQDQIDQLLRDGRAFEAEVEAGWSSSEVPSAGASSNVLLPDSDSTREVKP